jgi:hypothetical protein
LQVHGPDAQVLVYIATQPGAVKYRDGIPLVIQSYSSGEEGFYRGDAEIFKDITVFQEKDPFFRQADIKEGKVKKINPKGEMLLKKAGEREYIFEHAWRQVREKFYVEDLQGVDWPFYKKEYEKFLPYITNSYDFTWVFDGE